MSYQDGIYCTSFDWQERLKMLTLPNIVRGKNEYNIHHIGSYHGEQNNYCEQVVIFAVLSHFFAADSFDA